jgi:hypothetical protein
VADEELPRFEASQRDLLKRLIASTPKADKVALIAVARLALERLHRPRRREKSSSARPAPTQKANP